MNKSRNLDWSNVSVLQANLNILTPTQENRLLYSREELERGNRVDDSKCVYGSYSKNSSIIAMSDWDRSKSYVMCGMYVDGRRKYCQEHRYCERCAYERSRKIYNKFISSWRTQDVHWYHLTYSFKSNLTVAMSDKQEYLGRWKEADAYIRQLNADGVICGAIVVNELSVAGLAGQTLFPHTHAVVISSDPNLDKNEIFKAVGSNVDLDVRKIDSEQYMHNCLRYPIKAIDLKKVYEEELPSHTPAEINDGVNTILETTTSWESGWKKIKYVGRMHHNNPQYVGYSDKPKKKRNKTLKSRKTSTKINDMDQRYKPDARAVLFKEANPVFPAPTIPQAGPEQPPRKKLHPLLTGGLMAGGLWGADQLFNKGQGTQALGRGLGKAWAGGESWLRDKFTSPEVRAQQSARLQEYPAQQAAIGAANIFPDKLRTPNAEGALATVDPLRQGMYAADAAVGIPALGATGLAALGKKTGWLGKMPTPGIAGKGFTMGATPATGAMRPLLAASKTLGNTVKAIGPVGGAVAGFGIANNPLTEEILDNAQNESMTADTKIPAFLPSWLAQKFTGRQMPGSTFRVPNVPAILGKVFGTSNQGGSPTGRPGEPNSDAGRFGAKSIMTMMGAGLGSTPIGMIGMPVVDAILKNRAESVKDHATNSEYANGIKEQLFQLYRGAKYNDVESRMLLKNMLETTPELKELQADPVIANLINRSKKELFEAGLK